MNRILIDTSVWIEFLKGNKAYFAPMTALMDQGEIYTLELIFAELVQGVKSHREMNLIEDFYKQLKIVDQPGLIFEAGEFSRNAGLLNRGVGLIDSVLIHATQKFHLELWTLDKKILGFLQGERVYQP